MLVGFNPAVADKPPTLDLHRTSNGMFRVEWDTRFYQGYLPQYTDKLVPPRWRNLVPRVMYESESYPYGKMSVVDVSTNTTQRFYRVRLVK